MPVICDFSSVNVEFLYWLKIDWTIASLDDMFLTYGHLCIYSFVNTTYANILFVCEYTHCTENMTDFFKVSTIIVVLFTATDLFLTPEFKVIENMKDTLNRLRLHRRTLDEIVYTWTYTHKKTCTYAWCHRSSSVLDNKSRPLKDITHTHKITDFSFTIGPISFHFIWN